MIKVSNSKHHRSNGDNGEKRMSLNFVLMREATSRDNTDDIKFSFVVRDKRGNVAHEETFAPSGRLAIDSECSMKLFNMKGGATAANGSIFLDGTLVIDVVVQALPKPSVTRTSLNPFQRNMLNLFYSGERADVAFGFGHFQQVTVRAHKFILKANAPALASFCDNDGIDGTVHMKDVSIEAFRFVLKYVYGGPPPNRQAVLKYGKEIIEAANRYDVLSLKLEIERSFLEMRVVDTSNCLDFICFAQENSCTILQKYAISYFVTRSRDIMNISEVAERLKESPDLMLEILCATMKIEPESTTNPKSKKRKDFMRRQRRNIGKKKNTRKKLGGKGKISPMPMQPSSDPKEKIKRKNSTVGSFPVRGSLLGTDTIRKNAIKVLQLCEEPRKISR